jgi:hypothetical protein
VSLAWGVLIVSTKLPEEDTAFSARDEPKSSIAIAYQGETPMTAIMHFATLAMATLLATGAAVLLDWLLLRAIFRLMAPAAQRPVRVRSAQIDLARGTAQLVRAYGAQR